MERELTFWEKAVWLTFNPSNNIDVQEIKEMYAGIIDRLNKIRWEEKGEKSRLLSIAITEAQTAQMRAVKWITWTE